MIFCVPPANYTRCDSAFQQTKQLVTVTESNEFNDSLEEGSCLDFGLSDSNIVFDEIDGDEENEESAAHSIYVKLSLQAIHFQPLSDIETQAIGPSSLSAKVIAARLSLFMRHLYHYMDETYGTQQYSKEDATIEGLRSVGWSVQKLRLVPPPLLLSIVEHHTFWLVTPPEGALAQSSISSRDKPSICDDDWDPEERQFVIDFHFTDLFEVARPTAAHSQFLHDLCRSDFVGSVRELRGAIGVLSISACQSLAKRSLVVAPWRQSAFLESCFIRAIQNTVIFISLSLSPSLSLSLFLTHARTHTHTQIAEINNNNNGTNAFSPSDLSSSTAMRWSVRK